MSKKEIMQVVTDDKKKQIISLASSCIDKLERIQYRKGLTIYGTIGNVLSNEDLISKTSSLSRDLTQIGINKFITRSQNNKLNWFEKKIYISKHKYDKMQRDKELKIVIAGLAAEFGVQLGTLAFRLFANKKEKKEFVKRVFGIISFAAMENGKIPECNEVSIDRLLFI